MSSRSLNKVLLIGNLTADPELRYTPQGTAVCTFSIATNRSWIDQAGQAQDVAEFTRCVAWAKLAEACSKILAKGRKAYVEGRLQTREWEGQDKVKRKSTEVVIENMLALGAPMGAVAKTAGKIEKPADKKETGTKKHAVAEPAPSSTAGDEPVPVEDIPF